MSTATSIIDNTTLNVAEDKVSIVALPTRLIMANAPSIRAQLEALIKRGRHRLVLDLSNVEILDSSGLSVLISALKRARPQGGDVVLTGLNEDVRSLLELTRMQLLFCIFEDLDAAVAALS